MIGYLGYISLFFICIKHYKIVGFNLFEVLIHYS